MRTRLLAVALLGLLLLPPAALAEPAEFRVAGSYNKSPAGLTGEFVPVIVPWAGVNERADILDCLVGPFVVKDDVLTIQKPDRFVKLKLAGGDEASWTVLEAGGACVDLNGAGDYRITNTPMVRVDGTFDFGGPVPPPPSNTGPSSPPPNLPFP